MREIVFAQVEPAPFDPNSVEMVRLVAEGAGAKEKTHYYTMAMATHNIFPPPTTVGGEEVGRMSVYLPMTPTPQHLQRR